MQWLAWKPLLAVGILFGGGGWYGYHRYAQHRNGRFGHDVHHEERGGGRFDAHPDQHFEHR